jgi:hypothetical protein
VFSRAAETGCAQGGTHPLTAEPPLGGSANPGRDHLERTCVASQPKRIDNDRLLPIAHGVVGGLCRLRCGNSAAMSAIGPMSSRTLLIASKPSR